MVVIVRKEVIVREGREYVRRKREREGVRRVFEACSGGRGTAMGRRELAQGRLWRIHHRAELGDLREHEVAS